jgi:hypothetical protein
MMDKLIDLKRSKSKAKESMEVAPTSYEKYPYGSRLNFENDEVEKLGLGSMKVGDQVVIKAVGEVTSVSKNESTNGVDDNIGIQITKISISDQGNAKNAFNEAAKE